MKVLEIRQDGLEMLYVPLEMGDIIVANVPGRSEVPRAACRVPSRATGMMRAGLHESVCISGCWGHAAP